jgi:hypothetical protein
MVSIFLSLLGALYIGYNVALYREPIEKNIVFTAPAIKNLVKQVDYEHNRVGNISYLTNGPTFSQFIISWSSPMPAPYAPIDNDSPSSLALAYDGKPGVVQLKIPKDLNKEFPLIFEAYTEGILYIPEQIPFQIISEDNSYVILRIDVPPNHDVIKVSGRTVEDSLEVPPLFFLTAFFSGALVFIATLILYHVSPLIFRKYIVIIKKRLGYVSKH